MAQFLKLSFRTNQDLMHVRAVIKPKVEKNKAKEEINITLNQ